MFFDSKSLITTKRGITAGQRQRLNPEQKTGGKHQRKKHQPQGEFLEFPGSLKRIFNTNQKGKQLEKTCHVAAIHHESN